MEELKVCPYCEGFESGEFEDEDGKFQKFNFCPICGKSFNEAGKKILAARRAKPENKALTLFSAITESPEALAKFLRAVDVGKIKLSESFCKSDCGDDDGCPHELQCIINWLNQPYVHNPEGSEKP